MITKASSVFFVLRRKVPLCQSGGTAHTPRAIPFNVHIDRITPGYRQVVFQFSINLSTPSQLTAFHKWHRTSSHWLSTFFYKFCTMRSVLDKKSFYDYLRHLVIKILLALAD